MPEPSQLPRFDCVGEWSAIVTYSVLYVGTFDAISMPDVKHTTVAIRTTIYEN